MNLMFEVGDKIVHPLHGAGVIEAVEEREFLGRRKKYYVIKLLLGSMKILVPQDSTKKVGLRTPIQEEEVEKVLNILKGKEKYDSLQDWRERYSTNLEKLKSGSIYKVAEVIRALRARSMEKGLSSGEKKMLESAYQLLLSELAFVKNAALEEVKRLLDKALE
jgi:CarD family transcriptional regulator